MRLIAFAAGLLFASTAFAQEHTHDHAPPPAKAQDAPEHDHSQHQMPAPAKAQDATEHDHSHHQMPAPAPPAISDHAADRVYDPKAMAEARALLAHEHSGAPVSLFMVDILEMQARKGGDGYRWEGEAWYGGDNHRAVLKFEGEGELNGPVENAEIQALYARPIGPYFNLQAGIRYDAEPTPDRGYATVGVEGLAPYWFEVGGALFVSNKGDVHARFEGYYDLNVTQRLILQPRAEINIAAQDVPELLTAAGISTVEAELRLRYEIRREFAPYVGVSFERKTGQTADMARAAGERVRSTSFVTGVRLFF